MYLKFDEKALPNLFNKVLNLIFNIELYLVDKTNDQKVLEGNVVKLEDLLFTDFRHLDILHRQTKNIYMCRFSGMSTLLMVTKERIPTGE